MKILLLSPLPPPAGGIASWTKRILNKGLPNNWQIEHINTNLLGKRGVFGNSHFNIFTELKRSFRIFKKLKEKLQDKDIKIVHTNIPCSLFGMVREILNAIIVKRRNRKFILHCRCTVPNMVNTKFKVFLFKRLAMRCSAIISLNKLSDNFIKKNTTTKTYIIPNFVDIELSNDYYKRINDNIKSITYVGGVIPSKGCLEIIKCAKFFPEIEFRLIGNISNEIKNIAKPENVKLLGEQNKSFVNEELKKTDIFLFPSYFKGEGFSNALVEAMAYGLPCIATDWAANKDMIENKGGIVVQVKNSQTIVNAIKVLKDKSIRHNMSKWNIEKVKNNYSAEIVLKKYVQLYDLLVTGGDNL